MATLTALKHGLRQTSPTSTVEPLSDAQYLAGFAILRSASTSYEAFIVPQLSSLLVTLLNSHIRISVLEIGPGPQSVLGSLPIHQRRSIRRYVAYEPNIPAAVALTAWLTPATKEAPVPLPGLEQWPQIRSLSLTPDINTSVGDEKFDLVLFCHSMYGMSPKRQYLERVLGLLSPRGMVAVFHRETLHLDGLVCHRTAAFPTGVVQVANSNETLDPFASFIAGSTPPDAAVRGEWRSVCRSHCQGGIGGSDYPGRLTFGAPEVMVALTRHAMALPELTVQVPAGVRTVKNREAMQCRPAGVVWPSTIEDVQKCVRWALVHGTSLTVVGGGHSGQCLQPNVVAVDMGAFKTMHLVRGGEGGPVVVAEAGCTTGQIISTAQAAGLTVPLGARPSVGAGLWLQGGIGHLARQHGLSCDAIVGAVLVSAADGQVIVVGHVPIEHVPAVAVCPENEEDLLWGIKGAGTNVGIVISVTFKAFPATRHVVRHWVLPLPESQEKQDQRMPAEFKKLVATDLPRTCSVDTYLYRDGNPQPGQLHVGLSLIEACAADDSDQDSSKTTKLMQSLFGPECSSKTVDGMGLFDTEMYMSGMHSGHGGRKTSSFKRCVFLKGSQPVSAFMSHSSPPSYLHLVHGGGAVAEVAPHATAFGCRDWDYACVVTGVWPRDRDGTEESRAAVSWVYDIVGDLLKLPACRGVYGADLGSDPRDAPLVDKAFGPNGQKLARLKSTWDPRNVLGHACPLPRALRQPELIILVTGEHGVGKDYCADVWVSVFKNHNGRKDLKVERVSISDVCKREYAASTGANLERLLEDRGYKEQHRPALTGFFADQKRQRPRLPEEHFLSVTDQAADEGVDVLLITGMRDEAPMAAFSNLVPGSRLVEVRVTASEPVRSQRREFCFGETKVHSHDDTNTASAPALDHPPTLVFDNDQSGKEAVSNFAKQCLVPFLDPRLKELSTMVRPVSDFPWRGIDFRHLLGIAERPGGLKLCTTLLQIHFVGDWDKIGALVCCEAGGFIFASPLASRLDLPLALIRQAGKLPPPTVSVVKSRSHISSTGTSREESIEMSRHAIPWGASVVVVDDVLATGTTLCAVLGLLREAGVRAEKISVMVVAEFPVHRGRDLLYRRGFGAVNIQSLLVFPGV